MLSLMARRASARASTVGAVGAEQVVRQPLRRLRADARQLAQFLHQAGDGPDRLACPTVAPPEARYIPRPAADY